VEIADCPDEFCRERDDETAMSSRNKPITSYPYIRVLVRTEPGISMAKMRQKDSKEIWYSRVRAGTFGQLFYANVIWKGTTLLFH